MTPQCPLGSVVALDTLLALSSQLPPLGDDRDSLSPKGCWLSRQQGGAAPRETPEEPRGRAGPPPELPGLTAERASWRSPDERRYTLVSVTHMWLSRKAEPGEPGASSDRDPKPLLRVHFGARQGARYETAGRRLGGGWPAAVQISPVRVSYAAGLSPAVTRGGGGCLEDKAKQKIPH